MNVVFTKRDFTKYLTMVKSELPIHRKYLKKGARILDCGCGLGCNAIPLSLFGYTIVGIDTDNKVLKCARINAKQFGKNVKILHVDIHDIDKRFKQDSFDACIHGGTIEHFPRKEMISLLRKQLKVAPIIIGSVPVFKRNSRRKWDRGVYMNRWTAKYWLKVLKPFNIVEHRIGEAAKVIGGFDELLFVIKRKQRG